VLRTAATQLAEWIRDGVTRPDTWVAVNLSARQLATRNLTPAVARVLADVGLPPGNLHLEVTESGLLDDIHHALDITKDLAELGVHISIDDFGTGYSSLSYLRDLPFHAVKIDRSFIHKMTTEARDFGLVKSIDGLVHYLGMECIAEGVETQQQLDLIGMMDCNYWQGFLFSRPLPASQIEPLLHDTRRKPGMTLVASS
jgi:EAL domain-containing protein (putative c-di-GMP-specific phosphodiesterase class I)